MNQIYVQDKLINVAFLCAVIGNEFEKENSSQFKGLRNVAFGLLATWAVTAASPVIAAGQVINFPLFYFLF